MAFQAIHFIMPKRKKCPICHDSFPERSYYRHYDRFFDKDSNTWIDHEPDSGETPNESSEKIDLRTLIADLEDRLGSYFKLLFLLFKQNVL